MTGYAQHSLSFPLQGQWWRISSFFWKLCTRLYHARDLFSPEEMLILSIRNKCFFFEPSAVSAALNRKAESGQTHINCRLNLFYNTVCILLLHIFIILFYLQLVKFIFAREEVLKKMFTLVWVHTCRNTDTHKQITSPS